MDIELLFADPISEVYREKLQKFADYILSEGITENRPPSIEFPGMNRGKFDEINKLRRAYGRR